MYVLKLSYIFYCKNRWQIYTSYVLSAYLNFFNEKKETKENGRLSGKNCKLLIFFAGVWLFVSILGILFAILSLLPVVN